MIGRLFILADADATCKWIERGNMVMTFAPFIQRILALKD
jgi:hypothetical protein